MQPTGAIEFNEVSLEVEGQRFLESVNLKIPAGQIVAICGEADSGKSFILRLLQGLPGMQKEDRVRLWGDIVVDGESIFDLDESSLRQVRRRMGVVMRQGGLIDNMDIWHNITLPLVYHEGGELAAELIESRCQKVVASLGIDHLVKTGLRPVMLNREEKLLVALARAWVVEPQLLLADDPINGLGEAVARRFIAQLCQCPTGDYTRIVGASRLGPLMDCVERFLLLEDGKLVELGDAQAVRVSQHPWVRAELGGCQTAVF
ncbi:MAG: ABC-type transporter Mla maintaining outer membrane lipid asymmetry ATPase subunit MlaF [Candidatus Latescibacterota bacterium]